MIINEMINPPGAPSADLRRSVIYLGTWIFTDHPKAALAALATAIPPTQENMVIMLPDMSSL